MTVSQIIANDLVVALGELRVSRIPDEELLCIGLGSCIAFCAHDPVAVVAGMAHLVLPGDSSGKRGGPPAKFVDTGIPALIEKMGRLGASPERMVFKMAGGACVIMAPGFEQYRHVGERNVEAAQRTLASLGFRFSAEDTGGRFGRRVRQHVGSGRLTLSTANAVSYTL